MGDIKGIKNGQRGCDFNDRFQFEVIGSQITQNTVGFTCLNTENNGKFYWSKENGSNASSSYTITAQGGLPYNWGNGYLSYIDNGGCVHEELNYYAYRIDEYGNIEIDTGYNISNIGDGGYSFDTNQDYRDYFCDPYYDECTCPPYEGGDGGKNSSSKEPFGEPQSQEDGTIYCGPGIGRVWTGTCNNRSVGASAYSCNENSSYNSDCTTEVTSTSGSDSLTNAMATTCGVAYIRTLECRTDPSQPTCFRGIPTFLSRNYNTNSFTKLADEKDWSFFFGLAKQSSTAKLAILKNNEPQNSNGDICGDGGSEECWSTWNGTSVTDTGEGAGSTSATSQKWETRVRKVDLNDVDLQRYTIIVESKYYLRIWTGESYIRILVDSGTDTFAGNQNRGSIHEFTNEDFQAQIGQPVYGCINIITIDGL